MTGNDIFDELFVLEVANNHLGDLQRGLKIISNYAQVVRFNNVRAAIKLQLRDIDSFIHRDFRHREDIRYIKKTLDTRLQPEDFETMVQAIRAASCIPMATPFDELVTFFDNRHIPLAINHCVSLYPSEDCDIELNQIDFLRNRYPHHTIGFSTHEYRDWTSSMLMAYAKGARTFERHVDIQTEGMTVSPYCSLPEQVDTWFKAFHRAKRMCGAPGTQKRLPPQKEIAYLDSLVRGVYAKRDLPVGHVLQDADVYLAIPLQQGQISCRELMRGEVILKGVPKDQPIMIDAIDSPYANIPSLTELIYNRGLPAHHPIARAAKAGASGNN